MSIAFFYFYMCNYVLCFIFNGVFINLAFWVQMHQFAEECLIAISFIIQSCYYTE